MTEKVQFMAPNGADVAEVQVAGGRWRVTWDNPEDAGAVHYWDDGPSAHWDAMTLRSATGGERLVIWSDDKGVRWLTRHLVPAGPESLSYPAIVAARRDLHAAEAFDRARSLVENLDRCVHWGAKATSGQSRGDPTMRLKIDAEKVLELCREQSQQLARAWTRVLEEERAAGRGLAPQMEDAE